MIKLVEVRLANLASEAQLVRACGVGDDIGYVEGEVTASFRIRETSLLEALNPYVWSPRNLLAFVGCVWTEEQPHILGIKAAVEVVEKLVEIVCTSEHLVGQLGCEGRVER